MDELINIALNNGAGVVGMFLMYKLMKIKIANVDNCPYVKGFREMKGGKKNE